MTASSSDASGTERVFPTVSAAEISNAAHANPSAVAPLAFVALLTTSESVRDGHGNRYGFCGLGGRSWKNGSANAGERGGERQSGIERGGRGSGSERCLDENKNQHVRGAVTLTICLSGPALA